MGPFRVAACHVAPVFLNAAATTDKALRLIREAASHQAHLVVFPESFIPAFPHWSALRAPAENHDLFKRMAAESITIDGEHVSALRAACRDAGIMLSLGFSERAPASPATLYNSNLILAADGSLAAHHRKLMPTFFEKLTWSPGDGHGLRVVPTPAGGPRLGALICGENTNPLARYALMAQHEQLHVSTWPPVWPTRFLDEGAHGNYDNVAANRTRAAAHCFEAKCFGVMCAGALDADAVEQTVAGARAADAVRVTLERAPRGATMFLDPTGGVMPGFTMEGVDGVRTARDYLQDGEGVLYCDLDVAACVEGKQYHDVTGGYQRLDVFDLAVNRERRRPARFGDGGPGVAAADQ